MNESLNELLYRSFDTTLSDEEQQRLDEGLKQSEGLRQEYDRLKTMRRIMAEQPQPDFMPGFADRVLQRLEDGGDASGDAQLFFEALWLSFRRMGTVALLLLIAAISYNIGSSDNVSLRSAFNIPETTMEEIIEPDFYQELESLR